MRNMTDIRCTWNWQVNWTNKKKCKWLQYYLNIKRICWTQSYLATAVLLWYRIPIYNTLQKELNTICSCCQCPLVARGRMCPLEWYESLFCLPSGSFEVCSLDSCMFCLTRCTLAYRKLLINNGKTMGKRWELKRCLLSTPLWIDK